MFILVGDRGLERQGPERPEASRPAASSGEAPSGPTKPPWPSAKPPEGAGADGAP